MELKIKFADFLKQAFFNDAKFTCIAAGRQTGKTYNAAIWIFSQLLTNENKKGLWVDTVQGNLDRYVDRYFRNIFAKVWHLIKYDKVLKLIKFDNGSYMDLRSAERPENMQGFNYDYVVLNEAGIILKNEELWYNAIFPMCQNAIVKIIGTPKGKNLFHKLFRSNSKEWDSYKFSCYDSPYWDKERLENVKIQVPEDVFKQEFLGEFLDNEGIVFKKFSQCIKDYEIPKNQLSEGLKFYIGVDLAKFSDFTVITVMNDLGEVVDYYRFNKIDYTTQKIRIYSVWEKYGKPYIMMDATGVGAPIVDDINKETNGKTIGYVFNNQSKRELIETLSLAFEKNEVVIPKAYKELINELEIFEYSITSTGLVSYSAPEGYNDDCVISLALCYYLYKQKKIPYNSKDIQKAIFDRNIVKKKLENNIITKEMIYEEIFRL